MKISYDNISGEYSYPLSKKDIGIIKRNISAKYIGQIYSIRFGCNTKTTQEGRIVKRGDTYEIRINFCLNKMRSPLLSEKKQYISQIRSYGGVIDLSQRCIGWNLSTAKRYALYLLLHEISHIIFCDEQMGGEFNGRKGSLREEQWCDDMASNLLQQIHL
jgi:hypothetical protein